MFVMKMHLERLSKSESAVTGCYHFVGGVGEIDRVEVGKRQLQ